MSISPSDPRVVLAGIRQFGLAPDRSDLQDLAYAVERQDARVVELEAALRTTLDALESFAHEANWGASALSGATIAKVNEAPGIARAALHVGASNGRK